MKLFLLLSSAFLLASGATCKNNKTSLPSGCYKGKLEIKANCMNYTISVQDGRIDTSLVEKKWTDETTGKTYSNVFALGSRCTFPERLNEGDEFYFMIDSSATRECAVCMMYYPVPAKHISIKVLDKSCE